MSAPDDDIYTLWVKVQEHPDFIGGTIWTRDDLASALFDPEGYEEPNAAQVAQVTEEQMAAAVQYTESYLDNRGYSWQEALQDCDYGSHILFPKEESA